MSWGTSLASAGGANNKTSGASLGWTVNASVAAKRIMTVSVACDNVSTADGQTSDVTGVTDSQGNTYVKLGEYTHSPGGVAGDGVTVALFAAHVDTALTTGVDTLTVSFRVAVLAKAGQCASIQIGQGMTFNSAASLQVGSATASLTGPSLAVTGLASANRLWVEVDGVEGPSTDTYTTGAGFATGSRTMSGGAADSNVGVYRNNLSATATGEAYQGQISVARDWASLMVALDEYPIAVAGALVVSDPSSVLVSDAHVGLLTIPAGAIDLTVPQALVPSETLAPSELLVPSDPIYVADARVVPTKQTFLGVDTDGITKLSDTAESRSRLGDVSVMQTALADELSATALGVVAAAQPTSTWIVTKSVLDAILAAEPSLASIFNTPATYVIGTSRNPATPNVTLSQSYKAYSHPPGGDPAISPTTNLSDDLANSTGPQVGVAALMYDCERWASTPDKEQQNPGAYMASFVALAHAHGYPAILAPARDLMNATTFNGTYVPVCTPNSGETLDTAFLRCGIPAKAKLAAPDLYHLQSQADQLDPSGKWLTLVSGAHAQVSPVPMTAGLSSGLAQGYATGAQLFAAASAAQPYVTGFWLNAASADPIAIRNITDFLLLYIQKVEVATSNSGSDGRLALV